MKTGSTQPKRIGIDARFWGEAGPGRYIKNIISHLEAIDFQNQYFIYLKNPGFETYQPQNPNFTKILANYSWYSFEEQVFFLWKLFSNKLDLLYVPHFNVPVLYPGALVTAIADLIMHTFSTEQGTTLPKFYYKFKKAVYYIVVFWAVLRSKKIIVPSNETKKDLMHHYGFLGLSKYEVAYEGVDPDLTKMPISEEEAKKVLDRFGIKKPFLLYVGSMYRHKNLDRLIAAFQVLKVEMGFSGNLILAGKKDLFSLETQELVKKLDLAKNVLFPGNASYLSDYEISALRSEALLYVFPSLKEGFSLTPLEAMSKNLACAVSRIPCHEEIYGDSVVYFDPYNVLDIANKIQTLIANEDVKQEFIKKGIEKVKQFSWEQTAKKTLGVFNYVLKNS